VYRGREKHGQLDIRALPVVFSPGPEVQEARTVPLRHVPCKRRHMVAINALNSPLAGSHLAFLLESLSEMFEAGHLSSPGDPDWTIFTSRPLPPSAVEERFGCLTARAVPMDLKDAADSATCRIESMREGWLFLVPSGMQSCGTAAMAFDLICGDGTANAIRETILACAVRDSTVTWRYAASFMNPVIRDCGGKRKFKLSIEDWNGVRERSGTGSSVIN
jgi:hypothetical protein